MKYPETSPRPVVDEYYGVKVEDPYRWLEDAKDPTVRDWTEARNRLMREFLDAVLQRPGQIFAIKRQPPLQQPMLVILSSADDLASEQVLLDPNQLDPSGGIAIDFFVASLDGNKVAVSLSKGGSERGDLYIYDVATRQPLSDVISRVQIPTGGGSFAWTESGDVYYTRYPRPCERPDEDLDFFEQIYFHQIG
ncbi:MAG TPA: hypothetical protein VI451_05130 [Anaerolineales bacterium]|nr:hypothetical protein [Anaerolineales bacterium]